MQGPCLAANRCTATDTLMISLLLKLAPTRLRDSRVVVLIADSVLIAGIGAYLYVQIHGNQLWEEYRASAVQRGVKLNFVDFIPPPAPDAENYAAIPLFQKAVASGNRDEKAFSFPAIPNRQAKIPAWRKEIERAQQQGAIVVDGKLPQKPPAPPKALSRVEAIRDEFIRRKILPAEKKDAPAAEAVLEGMEKFRPQLAELHEAAKRPKCRFQTDWRVAFNANYPHYDVLMNAGRALDARIRANLELGRGAAALSDVTDILAAYRALRTEPGAIGALTRTALLTIADDAIASGIEKHHWNDAELSTMESELAKIDLMADLEFWFSSERAMMNQTMEIAFGHIKPEGVRPFASIAFSNSDAETLARFQGWGRWNQTYINQFFDDYLARLDVKGGRWHGDFNVEHDPMKLRLSAVEGRLLMFAATMLPSYDMMIQSWFYTHTRHQLLRIGIAIERHRLARGGLPAKLDELVPAYLPALPLDVFTGQSHVYRVRQEGTFQLYGTAMNRVDDGGKKGDRESPRDFSDWVWPLR
jgi:hypothetical protein